MRALALALAFTATVALSACASAQEEDPQLQYTVAIGGARYPTTTGSVATGTARIDIDTETETIDVRVEIHGLRLTSLATHLSHAPVGPMHLHRYQGDEVTLIMPFPMGPSYFETSDGFMVIQEDAPYGEAAAIVQSELSFAQFLEVLRDDPVFLNIHTERFGDGEISGRLTSSPPAIVLRR